MRKIRTVSLLPGFFCAALAVFGQTSTPAPETSTTNLPPVGLASTETVQVNVVNNTPALPSTGATAAPATCSGSIAFYDASGSIIGSAADFKLSGSEMFSAKLPYASAAASGTARIVVRAAISVTMNIATPPTAIGVATPIPLFLPTCLLTSSLETYDTTTGVTHAYYAGGTGAQTVPLFRSGQVTAIPFAR